MFYDFVDNITSADYLAAMELLEQVADANKGKGTITGILIYKSHIRKVRQLTVEKEIGRDEVKRLLAVFANEVSTPMRCIAPMDVVSKAELRSENTH